MKRIIAAFALVLIVMVAVAVIMKVKDTKKEKQLRSHLIGAWVVISDKVDGIDRSTPRDWATYKHITPVGFIWLSHDKITGRITRAAGGTYTLHGNVYTEKIEYGIGRPSADAPGGAETAPQTQTDRRLARVREVPGCQSVLLSHLSHTC